ncbi:hypothetical protein G6514_002162 [Epicoccum nigrum]|nr:hypothetical protein G6514_002162 [Epicoccum nigrum]
MLWQSNGLLTRRSKEAFPSWSWVGWVGKIDVDKWKMGSNYVLDVAHNAFPGNSDTDNYSATYFRVFSTVPWVPVSAKSNQTLPHSSDASPEQQASLQGLIDHAEKAAHESLIGFQPQRPQWIKHGNHWFHPCDNLRRFRYPIPLTVDFPFHIPDLPTSLLHLKALTTTAQLWCVPDSASEDVDTGAFAYLDDFNTDSFNMDSFNMDSFNMNSFNMDSFNMDSFNMDSFNMDSFNMDSFNMNISRMDNFNTNEDSDAGHTYAKFNIYQSHKHGSSFRIGTVQLDGQIIGDAAAEKGKRYCDFVAISEMCARDDDKKFPGNERNFLRYVNVLWVEKVPPFQTPVGPINISLNNGFDFPIFHNPTKMQLVVARTMS